MFQYHCLNPIAQKGLDIFDERYKKKLYELRNCDMYQLFFDTIDVMIEYNCKLEQEVLISKN